MVVRKRGGAWVVTSSILGAIRGTTTLGADLDMVGRWMALSRRLPVLGGGKKKKKTSINSKHRENIHHNVQGSILTSGSSVLLMRDSSNRAKMILLESVALSSQVTL